MAVIKTWFKYLTKKRAAAAARARKAAWKRFAKDWSERRAADQAAAVEAAAATVAAAQKAVAQAAAEAQAKSAEDGAASKRPGHRNRNKSADATQRNRADHRVNYGYYDLVADFFLFLFSSFQ